MIARGDAGEPSNITEAAKEILDSHRATSPTLAPEDALSPYERELYQQKGIRVVFKNGWWRRSDEPAPSAQLPTDPERASSARTECLTFRLASHSTEILTELSKSKDPATRTAAILILDKRSRKTDTP